MITKCNTFLPHRLINGLFDSVFFLTRGIFTFESVAHGNDSGAKRLGKRQGIKLLTGTVRNKETGKRRYMKSSCRWATIRFHFDLPPSIVSCDCMWRSHTAPPDKDWCALGKVWHMSLTHSPLGSGDGKRTVTIQLSLNIYIFISAAEFIYMWNSCLIYYF